MTRSLIEVIVTPDRERPTHGYEVGQLLYDTLDLTLYRLVSRNPHVWKPVRGALQMKEGSCLFNGSTLKGEGILVDLSSVGATLSGNQCDINGTFQSAGSGTASIQNAGFTVLRTIGNDFQGFLRTDYLPYYAFKYNLNGRTSGDYRHYSGWIKNATGPAVGEDPILNTQGGIVVGFNVSDTTWSVWHSNGDGVTAVSKSQFTSVSVASGSTTYIIEMIFTSATNVIINIYNSSGTLIETKAVNTNLLPTAKSINWTHVIQNPNQTNKTIAGYALQMRSLS